MVLRGFREILFVIVHCPGTDLQYSLLRSHYPHKRLINKHVAETGDMVLQMWVETETIG